jgi:septal ring factor EnvC (AmiA/AmiB activator)
VNATRAVRHLVIVAALAGVLTACGSAPPETDARAASGLENARDTAQAASEDVADLTVRVVRLERRLLRAQSAHRKLKHVLARHEKSLAKSVSKLEATAKRLAKSSSAAAARADEAARVAAAAARDVTVLTRRFDYHLRHSGT